MIQALEGTSLACSGSSRSCHSARARVTQRVGGTRRRLTPSTLQSSFTRSASRLHSQRLVLMNLTLVRASLFQTLSKAPECPEAASPISKVGGKELEEACFGIGHEILGIDIGGTSIKAAPVDTRTGVLLVEKAHVIMTPQPATPESVADVLKQMVDHFEWKGSVGVGVPAVVRQGTTLTAANIDQSWIGAPVERLFGDKLGLPTTVVNDADAAGYAELGFGSGRGENERGVVFVATFGTGIGTAMFVDGILVPNLELGHIELDGKEAEHVASGVMVQKEGWTWEQWAERVTWYLAYIERLFWPTLFIVGGGVSNAHEEWLSLVKLPNNTPIVPASMKNDAGIVGAAMAALARAAYDIKKKPSFVEDYINA